MEERKYNATFYRSGSGSLSSRINVPIIHLRKMGITPEDKKFFYYFDEQKDIIIISKKELKNYEINLNKIY